MREDCAGGNWGGYGHSLAEAQGISTLMFFVHRNEVHCLGFAGSVLLLLGAARDAEEEVP